MIPESQQLLIVSDQGISLMNNQSGIALGFWVFRNQAQFDEFLFEFSRMANNYWYMSVLIGLKLPQFVCWIN